MAVGQLEIRVGCVAYFDAQALNADPHIIKTGDPVTRVGPTSQFVCYKVVGSTSWWTPLTGTAKPYRLRIDPAWLSARYGALGDGKVYLQDGKNTYAAASSSFVAASQGEVLHGPRPYLSAAGVVAIIQVVKERGGPV
jgi:hypothetical protein